MAINRELRKKRKRRNAIFGLLLLIVLIIFSYLMFNKFIIIPLKEKYKEKPVVIKEVPYEEEKKEEVQPVPGEMIEVNLYFSDSQAMYLVSEKRKIPQTTSLAMAKQIVVELIKGPASSDLYSTIPEGTRVNEVYIADDIVYVDLSEEVFKNHSGGSSGELMTVYSIVNSLTEISPIKGVQILVEGNERNSLVGHVDISMPLLRDEDWIKP
jgi:germination protein M